MSPEIFARSWRTYYRERGEPVVEIDVDTLPQLAAPLRPGSIIFCNTGTGKLHVHEPRGE
jgi:hypothetical protein